MNPDASRSFEQATPESHLIGMIECTQFGTTVRLPDRIAVTVRSARLAA
jgi:hypothetical protein